MAPFQSALGKSNGVMHPFCQEGKSRAEPWHLCPALPRWALPGMGALDGDNACGVKGVRGGFVWHRGILLELVLEQRSGHGQQEQLEGLAMVQPVVLHLPACTFCDRR